MPDPADFNSFLKLFDQIETESNNKFQGMQLACISKFVFYCGVRKKEIPEIRIRDVIDTNEKLITEIKRFSRPICLDRLFVGNISQYLAKLKEIKPSYLNRLSYLFPSYRNDEKLSRDWQRFGINYSKIKQAGIHFIYFRFKYNYHYYNLKDCTDQLRVTRAYFESKVSP